jgi:hypothetical protein
MRVIYNVWSNDRRRTAMKKLVGAAAVAAALSLAGWVSLAPASAAPVSPDHNARQADQARSTDISAHRRYYRRYGYYGPRYYRPYRAYYRPYYRPYYGYGYGYRPYYRPAYYRPYGYGYPYGGYGFGPRFYGPGLSIGFGW